MKNRVFILSFLISAVVLSGFLFYQREEYKRGKKSFGKGEVIKYRAHYGFINAATGTMTISDTVYRINGKPCYKIDVIGESVGMFDLMLKIRDNWGTYLDTSTVVPERFWRNIREGKYRKFEIVDFDQADQQAAVVTYDFKKKKWKDKNYFEIPTKCQDLVSGYYYLRTLDLNQFKENDIIQLKGFFDDEIYKFNIRYLGIEEVKTKLGRYSAHVFSPIMPENGLFDGENSIRFWLSNDKYKIPLKIKADMFVGAVEIDITEYKPSQR